MKVELKTWAGLGLATALAGAGLAGCSEEPEPTSDASQSAQAGEIGEGGEGGESGEGGVDFASASTDPVEYGSALAVAEAHAIAARDAFIAGKVDAAAEMFAHPVSEVLAEMQPAFAARGVDDFSASFTDASAAILDGAEEAKVNADYNAIIADLRAAAEKAPDDGTPKAMVAASVISDMIGRANAMYRLAVNTERYEPYLDGYGFYKTAQATFDEVSVEIAAADATLHERLSEALGLLAVAYPDAQQSADMDADQEALRQAHDRVRLSLS